MELILDQGTLDLRSTAMTSSEPKKRRRQATPEETWIRGFLDFSGTDITAVRLRTISVSEKTDLT
jgi:hypothetical protein